MKQARIVNYLEPRLGYNEGRSCCLSTWRKKVLEKDDNLCKNCANSIKDEYRKRKIVNEAHHIIPRRHGGRNVVQNGITLCQFCHDYFDEAYSKYNLDYYEVLRKMNPLRRIIEVRILMRKRYESYLLGLIRKED